MFEWVKQYYWQFSRSWFCSKSFRGFFVFWWISWGRSWKFLVRHNLEYESAKCGVKKGANFQQEKNPWISEVCGAPAVWTHHLENTQVVQWMQLYKHLPTPPALRERERRPYWTPGFVTTVVGNAPVPSESRGSDMPSQLLPPFCTVPVRTLD